MIEKQENDAIMKKLAHTKRQSNWSIIKQVIFNDMIKSSFIRFLLVPILLTTIVYSYIEIESSGLMSKIDKAITSRINQREALMKYFLSFFLVLFLSEINGLIFTGVVQYICRITAKCNYENFISLPPGKFSKLGSGEIQTIIERKSKATSELVEIFIINLIPIIMKMGFALYAISSVMGILAGYIMLFCMLTYALITLLISVRRAEIRRKLNLSEAKASDKLQDGLVNQEMIWACQSRKSEIEIYDSYLIDNENNVNALWRVYYVQNFLQRLIFLFQTVLIVYAGISGCFNDLINTEKFIFFISLTGTVGGSLTNLGHLYTRYTQVMVRISSVHDLILKPNIEPVGKTFKNNIAFKNVNFHYEDKEIFRNLDLEIIKGDKIAIIGKNGSGKSSLLKLLLKYEDFNGEILIDGERSCIKKITSYLPQNYYLFNESVKFNIKYATENVPDEEIYKLCKQFGILETICNLKHGFDTKVGERGRFLSGGERQKIAIIRAILRNPEIYLLDEPTSALDRDSKNVILRYLLEDREKTVLATFNEVDFLLHFDKVFFIHDFSIEVVNSVDLKNQRFSTALKNFLETI